MPGWHTDLASEQYDTLATMGAWVRASLCDGLMFFMTSCMLVLGLAVVASPGWKSTLWRANPFKVELIAGVDVIWMGKYYVPWQYLKAMYWLALSVL